MTSWHAVCCQICPPCTAADRFGCVSQGRRCTGLIAHAPEILICFLASDEASFITRSYPLVDGGYPAQYHHYQ